MNILAIESSCDETAAAVVRDGTEILSSLVASQTDKHALYGGVVPEIASRMHIECISALVRDALTQASVQKSDIDAVAVTYAPGLIGALLVGLNFAKAFALGLSIPLIPVHHLRGHIASLYLDGGEPSPAPPFAALIVSGGHSIICHVKDYTTYELLGSTRDDAAGECFDKVARTFGLPYPGGAALSKLSENGDTSRYAFPRGIVRDHPLDMSFSGLKTAAVNQIHNAGQKGEELALADFCASFEQAVTDTLVPRLLTAARKCGCKTVCCAGGVAANARLRRELTKMCKENGLRLHLPSPALCGDNAAMIAAQGFHEYRAGNISPMNLNAYASRGIDVAFIQQH